MQSDMKIIFAIRLYAVVLISHVTALAYQQEHAIEDIFYACGVELPGACTNTFPPKEFLGCARESESSADKVAGPIHVLIVSIVLGIYISM